jgi:transcriptional regulator with XRE-family HTH domain
MTGDEFRAWREARGITQQQAADAAGIKRLTVIRAEKAEAIPGKLAALVGKTTLDAPIPTPPAADDDPPEDPAQRSIADAIRAELAKGNGPVARRIVRWGKGGPVFE